MLTRLLILWLLSEGPLHGYRIKKVLEESGQAFWFPVEFGSIYAVLRTLVREGQVRALAAEREGQRPQRTRYAITPAGRRHHGDLLRRAWRTLPSPAEPFHVALAAQGDLDPREEQGLLAERIDGLRARLLELDRLAPAAPSGDMVERQRALTRAELRWAQRLMARLEGRRR